MWDSSKYNNVCKLRDRYRAQIYSRRRSKNLGFYPTEIEAARVISRVQFYISDTKVLKQPYPFDDVRFFVVEWRVVDA